MSVLAADGFEILSGAFDPEETARLREHLAAEMGVADAVSDRGGVYAARNLLDWSIVARTCWRRPMLVDLLRRVLGDGCGLVRGLYFDKPPGRTWSLPWHQDLTIAVARHRVPAAPFAKPTTKAGVPHVEATAAVLERMLTLRIRLDAITAANGPLRLLAGSHTRGKAYSFDPQAERVPLSSAGSVLAMRPLTAHASGSSVDSAAGHRRILHLEFAAEATLPGGYEWRWWIPVRTTDPTASGGRQPAVPAPDTDPSARTAG